MTRFCSTGSWATAQSTAALASRRSSRMSRSYSSRIERKSLRSAALPQRRGFLDISPPIGETTALGVANGSASALGIVDAQPFAVVVAVVEFVEIAMQVMLAHVLIRAVEPTLEDREEAFGGVGVDIAAHVFLLTVLDVVVAGEVP